MVACAIGCIAAGFGLARIARTSPRVEGAAAAIVVFIAPVLFFGRIEGETAPLVFTLLGATGLLLTGIRIARPRTPKASPPPPAIVTGDSDGTSRASDRKKKQPRR